jgi:hypothetical protein
MSGFNIQSIDLDVVRLNDILPALMFAFGVLHDKQALYLLQHVKLYPVQFCSLFSR